MGVDEVSGDFPLRGLPQLGKPAECEPQLVPTQQPQSLESLRDEIEVLDGR